VLTPGTGTPEVFAVPHGAHQAEEATHTEQPLLVDGLEHLKQRKWMLSKVKSSFQAQLSIPRAICCHVKQVLK